MSIENNLLLGAFLAAGILVATNHASADEYGQVGDQYGQSVPSTGAIIAESEQASPDWSEWSPHSGQVSPSPRDEFILEVLDAIGKNNDEAGSATQPFIDEVDHKIFEEYIQLLLDQLGFIDVESLPTEGGYPVPENQLLASDDEVDDVESESAEDRNDDVGLFADVADVSSDTGGGDNGDSGPDDDEES